MSDAKVKHTQLPHGILGRHTDLGINSSEEVRTVAGADDAFLPNDYLCVPDFGITNGTLDWAIYALSNISGSGAILTRHRGILDLCVMTILNCTLHGPANVMMLTASTSMTGSTLLRHT